MIQRLDPRLAWAGALIAIATAWWLVLPHLLRVAGHAVGPESSGALAWGVGAALVHGLFGARLLANKPDPDPTNQKTTHGIHGGLKVLALRYFTGVGLVLIGLIRFPTLRTVFVLAWSGLYLILIVSEVIVFSRGVKRL